MGICAYTGTLNRRDFSSFLFFFFFKSQLICSSPPSGQGCVLQSVKMADGPQIFLSPFKKNGQ